MFDACCRDRGDFNPLWPLAIGCDVARFGDDLTCIVVRWGKRVVHLETWSGVRTDFIARRCRELALEWSRLKAQKSLGASHRPLAWTLETDPGTAARRVPIIVDDTGGYGSGVVDYPEGYNFIGINMSSESPDARFLRRRTQLWCQLADLANHDGVDMSQLTPEDQKALRIELTSPRYTLDYSNRRVLESKAEIKRRLKRSPDRADALVLAFAV